MGDGTVDRRRFIGLGLTAAGSAAVIGPGAWTSRATLRWDFVDGFPGRPNALGLEAPDVPDGAEVEITVSVHGPGPAHSVVELVTARARVEGGATRIEAPLTYPYEERVAGVYRYVAEARWRGATVATEVPATYVVRAWLPLS